MKILHVNASDIEGGAARAAYRLHKALLSEGVDSQFLVQKKISDDYTVIGPVTKRQKLLAKVFPFLDGLFLRKYKNKTQTLFSSSWVPFGDIVRQINEINPDVVHLHWICSGMIRVEDLGRIKPPIVWSLHDMWAFTGGEHYDEYQKHYIYSCGNSKVLKSGKDNDLSRKNWQRKKKTYDKLGRFTVIGLSKWMQNSAKESSLLKDKQVINLPNLIDTDRYRPFGKEKARGLWGLPKNKKLILFGAMGATSDPRKGFKELSNALQKIDRKNEIELVVFGGSQPKKKPDLGFDIHYLGILNDDVSLVSLYNAVDVMVVPSLQENLSNSIMESLSCGTPVVAFDIGGNSDMVEHKQNGYLARPFENGDLCTGIDWVLYNKKYEEICIKARDKIVQNFNSHVVATRYIELYNEIIDFKRFK